MRPDSMFDLQNQKKHMICSTSYATKWYITLFANTFPFQTQLRLWDAFILEGRDAIVMIALAIIWVLRGTHDTAPSTLIASVTLLTVSPTLQITSRLPTQRSRLSSRSCPPSMWLNRRTRSFLG